jgi:hypothetical protein
MPSPSPGKALVFIGEGGHFGKDYQFKLALDGRWVAVLKKNEYTFFEVSPGVLKFCWGKIQVRSDNFLVITAQPNHTYWLRGTLRELRELDAEEGHSLIKDLDYVTFEKKTDSKK